MGSKYLKDMYCVKHQVGFNQYRMGREIVSEVHFRWFRFYLSNVGSVGKMEGVVRARLETQCFASRLAHSRIRYTHASRVGRVTSDVFT